MRVTCWSISEENFQNQEYVGAVMRYVKRSEEFFVVSLDIGEYWLFRTIISG